MIDGFQNEQIFIANINGRPYKIQNLLLQDLLKELYPKIKDEDIVYAYKYIYAKYLLCIVSHCNKIGQYIQTFTKLYKAKSPDFTAEGEQTCKLLFSEIR